LIKNRYLKITDNKKKIGIISLLFLFAAYCAISIGQSWDEAFHLLQGKITADYLVTFGYINNPLYYREYYSPIYFLFSHLVTNLFPNNLEVPIQHLTNMVTSFTALFGISKITKELFNKQVSYYAFIILFFYPIFFGHMGINGKDIILATCHVWMTYSILRYLKKRTNKYIVSIGILAAIGTGIQLLYLGSFLTIIIFVAIDIFLIKKFINKNFKRSKFFIDLIKCFIIFYFFLILFWIDVHPNIIKLPITIFTQLFSDTFYTGWAYNLVNGDYYLSTEVPKSYFLINFFYKTPFYVIFLYILFIYFTFKFSDYFKNKFKDYIYKLLFILCLMVLPNLLILTFSFPIYDGLRLFLWSIPYFVIIPSLVIYFLLDNIKLKKIKASLLILLIFFIYFLYNFFLLTPFQYSYLNILAGNSKDNYKIFENDYWGVSTKELIKHSKLEKNKELKINLCGVNNAVVSKYLKEFGYDKFSIVGDNDKAEYVFMTNRAVREKSQDNSKDGITNCYEKFKGKEINSVTRNGNKLSIIRKIN